MRAGRQVGEFGKSVDARLADLKKRLPDDLILARTSDQPRQVRENIDLFMSSLYEAIILVVVVSLIGFWEWRSALLMALSIPITLAMTFGMLFFLGIDLQQISIASLIIALGLLVDDPVVAGDAIKRDLALGPSATDRGLARPDEAGDGDSVRHHHQYRGVSAVHVHSGRHRQIPLQHAGGDWCFAGGVAAGFDDVHPAARLLHPQAQGGGDH
jgi:hypothetical protein